MIALLIFILSSSSLFIVFRGLGKDKDPLQVILFNYLFCILFSFSSIILEGETLILAGKAKWFFPALFLGVLFLINFSFTEQSVRRLGLSVSSVANKLSLILPFFFTILISGQQIGFRPMAGLLLCVLAIFLSAQKTGAGYASVKMKWVWLLPVVVFLGSGFTDILTQSINQHLVPESQSSGFVFVVFFGAFLAAGLLTLIRIFSGSMKFNFRNAWPGFWLGLPNFISYKSILLALNAFEHKGNVVFPVANLGVIVFTSLVSYLYFRDKFSKTNLAGILISLLALLLLFQP